MVMKRLISLKCTLNPTTDTLFVYSAPLLAIFFFYNYDTGKGKTERKILFSFCPTESQSCHGKGIIIYIKSILSREK